MKTTLHIQQRMSQRGITRDIIDFVIDNGLIHQNKYFINRKEAETLLQDLKRREKLIRTRQANTHVYDGGA